MKYTVNSNYFNQIDSPRKAYILGFWYADGYNYTNGRYRIVLNLEQSDKQILDNIKEELQYTGPLLWDKKDGIRRPQYRLCINNKKLSLSLEKHGCPQAKTFILKFPKFLDKKLFSHFIRGYFDGDGSIIRVKSGKYYQYEFNLIGTENMILTMGSYLKDTLNLNITISSAYRRKNKNGNPLIKELRISGKKNMIKIMELLYTNKENLYLERKYQKYLLFKNDKTSLTVGRK